MSGTEDWHDLVDTPALVVDRAVVEANVARVAVQMRERSVALRPHFKTHKTSQIARLQRRHGAVGQTCATLGEAQVLADAGISDIFVAYPVWPSRPKQRRLLQLLEQVTMSVGCDSVASAEALGSATAHARAPLSVLVEVDTGGRRTGCPPAAAGSMAVAAARSGLDVAGVFTHGGHSYRPDAAARAAREEVTGLETAVQSLREHGLEARVVSAGSTPTAVLSAEGLVTEERPGTYVFGDRQQVAIGSCRPEDVALRVATTVVSDAVPGQVALDSGTKCLGRETQPWLTGYAEVVGRPDLTLERLYDHHGIATVGADGPRPRVGEILSLVPNHVCPVVNLARDLVVVEDGSIVDHWPVAARAVI